MLIWVNFDAVQARPNSWAVDTIHRFNTGMHTLINYSIGELFQRKSLCKSTRAMWGNSGSPQIDFASSLKEEETEYLQLNQIEWGINSVPWTESAQEQWNNLSAYFHGILPIVGNRESSWPCFISCVVWKCCRLGTCFNYISDFFFSVRRKEEQTVRTALMIPLHTANSDLVAECQQYFLTALLSPTLRPFCKVLRTWLFSQSPG